MPSKPDKRYPYYPSSTEGSLIFHIVDVLPQETIDGHVYFTRGGDMYVKDGDTLRRYASGGLNDGILNEYINDQINSALEGIRGDISVLQQGMSNISSSVDNISRNLTSTSNDIYSRIGMINDEVSAMGTNIDNIDSRVADIDDATIKKDEEIRDGDKAFVVGSDGRMESQESILTTPYIKDNPDFATRSIRTYVNSILGEYRYDDAIRGYIGSQHLFNILQQFSVISNISATRLNDVIILSCYNEGNERIYSGICNGDNDDIGGVIFFAGLRLGVDDILSYDKIPNSKYVVMRDGQVITR